MENQRIIWQQKIRQLNKDFEEERKGVSSVDILMEIGHLNIEIGKLNSLLRSRAKPVAVSQQVVAVIDDCAEDEYI